MCYNKILTFVMLCVILSARDALPTPSFTYTGPTVVDIAYPNNSVQGVYDFTYNNMQGLYYPCLVVSLDGNVISNDLCHNPTTP
jgi:hypothetical protein